MSPSQRYQQLQAAYLAGELSDADAAEFAALLTNHPALRRAMLDDLEVEGLLGQLHARDEAETFRRSLMTRLQAQSSATRIVQKVAENARRSTKRQVSRRVVQRPPVSSASWIGMAAMIAAAVTLALIIGGDRKRGDEADTAAAPPKVAPVTESAVLAGARTHQARVEATQRSAEELMSQLEIERERIEASATLLESERQQALQELALRHLAVEKEMTEWSMAHTQQSGHKSQAAAPATALNENVDVAEVVFAEAAIAVMLVRGNGERIPLRKGLVLHTGDRIESPLQPLSPSGERDVAATVAMRCGATIDLADGTVLNFIGMHALTFSHGLLFADVNKDYENREALAESYKLVITTPAASAGIRGTRFELSSSKAGATVRMDEGHLDFFNERGLQSVATLQECKAALGSAPTAPSTFSGVPWRGRHGTPMFSASKKANGTDEEKYIFQPEVAELLKKATQAAIKEKIEEASKYYLEAVKLENSIALHRRMAHVYFDVAEKIKKRHMGEFQASLTAMESARKGAFEEHRSLHENMRHYKEFNPENPAFKAAVAAYEEILKKISQCFSYYTKAQESFGAVLRLSPMRKDFDAAGHLPLCLAAKQNEVNTRTRCRQLLVTFLAEYKPSNASERALYQRCHEELERIENGKE